ncbi:hypothetical protein [Streptosporangium carneum]|uniref:Uncharacterized protein n=1 Tax=Streptosporangium carneum TaxID=47481 RepID=A0A9W6HXL8_9ACTN|nr:hypothetical protein [Streptosporangium carneum]GLK07265.1 hypothetical protein GCM10017600_06700 [Streptosporangium carneum]
MSYAPLWPDWADQTRQALACVEELPEDSRTVLQDLAAYIGEELRMEFPDVEPGLVGWITLRAASHLGGLIREASGPIEPSTYVTIGLLAGDHLVGSP